MADIDKLFNRLELLLDRIEKNGYDTLNHRASLSKFQKFKLLSVIWLRSRGIRFI